MYVPNCLGKSGLIGLVQPTTLAVNLADIVDRHILTATCAIGELDHQAVVEHVPRLQHVLAGGAGHVTKVFLVVRVPFVDLTRDGVAVMRRDAPRAEIPPCASVAGRLVNVGVKGPSTAVTAQRFQASMIEHTFEAQVGHPAVVACRHAFRLAAHDAEHERIALLNVIAHCNRR